MITIMALAVSSVAYAGCTKDTDCKGDRICNLGTCENPPTDDEAEVDFDAAGNGRVELEVEEAPAEPVDDASSQTYSRATMRRAEEAVLASKRGTAGGYALAAPGALLGYIGTGFGSAGGGDGFFVVGGLGLTALGVAGPVAAGGGTAARNALLRLDVAPPDDRLLVTGWLAYSMGLGFGVGAIASGVEQSNSTGRRYDEQAELTGILGVLGTTFSLGGTVLLAVDATQARRVLEARIDELSASRGGEAAVHLATAEPRASVPPSGPRLTQATLVPNPGGAGLVLSGSF